MTSELLEVYNLMLKDNNHWGKMKLLDLGHIEFRRQTANGLAQRFLSTNSIKLDDKSQLFKMRLLSEYYKALCFFGTDDVKEKFKELGVSKTFLIHFIPFDTLLNEFDKIEANTSSRILRIPALFYIQHIVEAKVFTEMLQWGGYVEIGPNQTEKVILIKIFQNLYRQRKYQLKHGRKEGEDFISVMQEVLDFIEYTLGSENDSKKLLLQSLYGKTVNFYLREFFEECFLHENNEIPKEFFADIFDLVKLVTNNMKMYSESEYQLLENGKYYGKSYRWYKNHIVKKIIYQK